jgi:hypothetical protein
MLEDFQVCTLDWNIARQFRQRLCLSPILFKLHTEYLRMKLFNLKKKNLKNSRVSTNCSLQASIPCPLAYAPSLDCDRKKSYINHKSLIQSKVTFFLVNHALLPFFCCFIYCVIKCVKSSRVLKGKFASFVFQSCIEKTPKTRKLVSGPQCVKILITIILYTFISIPYLLPTSITYQSRPVAPFLP